MNFRDYSEIIFTAGDVLSAEMLEETYRYPREFLHVCHAGCPDGIVAGLDFIEKEDGVYLTAGIVKFDGKYYILPGDMGLDAWLQQQKAPLQSSVEYLLCLVPEDVPEPVGTGIQSRSRLVLQPEKERPAHALLLGRYKYRPDVQIRLPKLHPRNKAPFEEFTQASFLQILDCEYAHHQGETTYHPLLFRAVQSYLEQKDSLSPYDFTLLCELQNHGVAALSTLKAYIAVHQKVTSASLEVTRERLFEELTKCVQMPYRPAVFQEAPTEEESRTEVKHVNKLLDL
ncbi:hypothetical protein [uncultured Selenomonas sp.]|uniref:hypothetical protein n=1 Tax=uncultured Selenomonas sp. TaxID=159275 RepID=UPI0028DC6408|nr:hypothetical protein [uncultured Selenomonas sp.]